MWGKLSRKEYSRKWRAKNKNKLAARARQFRIEDPVTSRVYHRRHHLKHTHGITLEEFNLKLALQDNVCAVCHRPETQIRRGTIKSLDVDHNHETHQIRGLLCSLCNTALGLLQDDPLRIESLLRYIKLWQ